VYIERLMTAAAASWTSSSSSLSMDSFSPWGGLLDESCGNNEVFLPDGEEKRTSEKKCEVTDALEGSVECFSMLCKSCVIVIK